MCERFWTPPVDVRIADKTVEIFHRGSEVRGSSATPVRPTGAATHDCQSHAERPSPPRQVEARRTDRCRRADWSIYRGVIAARPHPEQGFRTCLGVLSLTRSYDNARVDAACRRGIPNPLCRPVVLHLTLGQDANINAAPYVLAIAHPCARATPTKAIKSRCNATVSDHTHPEGCGLSLKGGLSLLRVSSRS